MSETDLTLEGDVQMAIENEIATIEFSHPASNSLPGNVLQKLADTIIEAGKNDTIKVIILKSAGDRVFCAGASFDELISIKDFETGKEFFSGFAKVINAARKCPKLIIGRVQGKTVGGGIGMIAATDTCYATKFASVRLSELAIGIGPFVVGPAVERKVGKSAFTQMSITPAQWYTAQWAKEKGLFAEVFESVEELDEAVKKQVETLATYNPEAMALLKTVCWEGTENWDTLLSERAEMSGKLVLSEFTV
ncbi:enoyl-CoA hydratase/isomerase family protein, partial [Bacteroidales bacterium AH-315-I05]|nr:enoyl-CoA hydratase/isomerase family protein [Bacteroidales bacterium AH-315-I05]